MIKRPILTLVLILLVLFIIGSSLLGFYTEWLWFKSLGYTSVFLRLINYKLLLGGLFGIFSALLFYLHGRLVFRLAHTPYPFNTETVPINIPAWLEGRLQSFLLPAAILVGIFMGLGAAGQWESFQLFLNTLPIGQSDPVFKLDISFYLFRLPFLHYMSSWFGGLWFVSLLSALFIIVFRFQFQVSPKGVILKPWVKSYLFAVVGVLFLFLTYYFYLSRFDLLFTGRGVVFGPGFVDQNYLLPVLGIMIFISLLTGLLFLFQAFKPEGRWIYGVLAFFVGAYIIGIYLLPGFVQRFIVTPNEIQRESPYLSRYIQGTLQGYGLGQVEERQLSAETTLTPALLDANSLTVKNIRLWDHRPLLETFSQIQEIRTYYKFLSVDNDRYYINKEYRQVLLSPRELSYADLPSKNWINEHLIYTHGYGLTLGVVNQVTQEGLPALLIQDIPPVSKTDLKVAQPEIYFSEIENDYIIVNSRQKEFNYPSGDQNVFASYQGKGGIPIGGFLKKALWSLRFGAFKILLSSDISPQSRILFDRSIRTRVQKLVPFLQVDQDPYMVVSGERLFWILDAYALSSNYPYSRPVKKIGNYIRNSVVAVVDAYEGSVQLFIKDEKDPLTKAYARIFPDIFKPLEAMDPDLKSHLRYPHFLFDIQSRIYATYHMTNPQTFYNREDVWEIPANLQSIKKDMESYYTIMRLPGEKKEEFILMIPFTPQKKDNLAAWMSVKCDFPDFGKFVVYRFPKQRLVYGPKQIESRINQDPEISRQLSLWDQRGSNVTLGTLLVIPIEESLIYVQPLYIKAETGQIPELKRVVVAYENQIAMEETLEKSLGQIFGRETRRPREETSAPPLPTDKTQPVQSLGNQAWQYYQKARNALKEENWTAYGQALKDLEQVLIQMKGGKR
ncbi:MAG: hypothetical protein A2Y79_05990 [Deltaproteobacteria bacterium RBG_13_43_22]|nr:MAG: hypothetical protein A2Y79_05990 [Deltaproteobacteria bacterium RBG_13_43_22]